MKHGYKNPLVTYEEIVEAIKAIIECSLNNNYMDDFDYLNLKYESESSVQYEGAEERALYKAVKSLEKTIDSANKIIKENLSQNLRDLEASRFTIHVDYLIGQERRKLAASSELINKLYDASINLNTLFNANTQEEVNDNIEPIKAPTIAEVFEETIDEDSDEDVDLDLDLPADDEYNTNEELSNFEKKVLIDFPEFFKEELEIAKRYSDDNDFLELDELYNTMELEPLAMDYVACESLEDEEDDSDIILADDIVDVKTDENNFEFDMPSLTKKEEFNINESKTEKNNDFDFEFPPIDKKLNIEEPKEEKDEFDFQMPVLGKKEEIESTTDEKKEVVQISMDDMKVDKSNDTTSEDKIADVKEEAIKPTIDKSKINKEKVLLIKRALEKAKSMNDEKLIETLKKQLAKELGVGK